MQYEEEVMVPLAVAVLVHVVYTIIDDEWCWIKFEENIVPAPYPKEKTLL